MKSDAPNYIIVEGKRLPLIAKKHPRARNIVVRYDAKADCVRVSLPRYVSLKAALAFAESRAGWIAAQRHKHPPIPFADGARIPFFGEEVTLRHTGGRGVVRREGNEILVPGEVDFMARRVRDFIKQETKKIFEARTKFYATQLGMSFRSIVLRDTTSRWGSCSSKGSLSFCWRLCFAPYEVLDYIVVHEVVHLKHHNHGAAYWKLVETLCLDYEKHERWLKLHGKEVWTYG